ncbi:ABC transporter substrate-binding protein [Agromyces rhizosphaerae]|uniref:ABC transporter substrate-binding protein n=1 Tax=Agromyces rhizosphaerae TaxID=88374 RepID=A0A9W6D123_9MICO|nr:ABC transporter substrate-binding protein [Agromyces rhizosphaerae]GLI27518.1 ABC transporter substrate-binding protein [Agromyces rhizosphaerae]
MTQHTTRWIAALGAAALAVPALAACSTPGDAAPGVTEESIVIGTHQPLTGPAAAGYASISAATQAYFDYVNDNGGINGRTIEYLVKDDGYNPAETQTVVRELVLEDEVFAIVGGLGTPTHSAVLDFLNDNEVPDLFVASGSLAWDQPEAYPMTFGVNTDYTREGKILGAYAAEEFPDGTYCYLGQDDDFGEDFSAGVLQTLGADFAESQVYTVSNQDVSAQVVAMQSAGCDVAFLASIPGFTALTIGTAAQLGWFPQYITANPGADYPTLAEYLGESAPLLLEGFISSNYLGAAGDDSDEWVQLFRDINDEYGDPDVFNGNTVYGMAIGYLTAEALAKAGDNPTRESLLEVVASGELVGSGVVPLAFGADSHSGYAGAQITQVVSGAQVPIDGSPFVTDSGDGPVEVYEGGSAPIENDGIPVG